MRVALLIWTVILGLACASAPAQVGGKGKGGKKLVSDDLTPAETARKVLNEKITIDYAGQSLQDVIDHLRQKTKVNFVLEAGHNFGMPGMMPPGAFPGGGFPGGPPGGPGQFNLKVTDGKLRPALRSFLEPYHLTYVILADRVLITSAQTATQRQLQQRVSLDFRGTNVFHALRKLARETGANLVFDHDLNARTQVELQLDDTSLETAVRLLTEMAGLKAVPMDNVLFVTSAEKGTKLLKENERHGTRGVEVPHYTITPPLRFRGGVGAAPGGGFGVAAPGKRVPVPPPAAPMPR